ncbi:MAG TPA: dihydrolipoyl dehydrogenase [Candidatus Krumholzibacteria bacterium]|nr:dihydrolipoyl dehydrogenase [Candidatus Krumholzibacteria bacterium]HRX49989.1 dihydrolipoyl dehydrogenase [Candidatus Krumholzibacteria bacterium]
MSERTHDLVIIGAGPAGYAAALRAAQLGLDTACIEREERLGGTCLRVGCIPSKALLESSEKFHEAQGALAAHGVKVARPKLDLKAMHGRKDEIVTALTDGIAGLFQKLRVTRYAGDGRLDGPGRVVVTGADGAETVLKAGKVLIATGSEPADLPGVTRDGDRIGDSTTALAYPAVPESLIVIGAGAIGLELGSVWSRLGAKITVLEYLDRILPGTDAEIARTALRFFKDQGLEFVLKAKVTGAEVQGKQVRVDVEGREPLTAARVLVAVGRRPHTAGLGLESVGVATDRRGFIPVNGSCETSAAGVFAVGDVIGGAMLAHKATDEAVACVERLAGKAAAFDPALVPAICYTDPEVAGVGRTEEDLKADGVPYRKGVAPFRANGRALALGHADGRVKVLAHKETDRLLGVHIVGPRAGDLIAEAAAAMAYGASSEDLARVCHAHPTLSEVLREAAQACYDTPLHG